MIENYERKFMSDKHEPRENTERFERGVVRGMGIYAGGLAAAVVAAALIIGNSDEKNTDTIACTGWTDFELAAGEPGYSAAISGVEFGPGVTQEEVTDAMAARNGTNIPRAGVQYEVPSRCEQDG